jgi:hypothetical protein
VAAERRPDRADGPGRRRGHGLPSGPNRGVEAALAFPTVDRLSMVILYGCNGGLASLSGDFDPGSARTQTQAGDPSHGPWAIFLQAARLDIQHASP